MQQTPVAIVEPPVPKEPPSEFEFLADPPTISALDLYVLLCMCFSFVEKINWYTVKKTPRKKEGGQSFSLIKTKNFISMYLFFSSQCFLKEIVRKQFLFVSNEFYSSINLLSLYHKCHSLTGYTAHYLHGLCC